MLKLSGNVEGFIELCKNSLSLITPSGDVYADILTFSLMGKAALKK